MPNQLHADACSGGPKEQQASSALVLVIKTTYINFYFFGKKYQNIFISRDSLW